MPRWAYARKSGGSGSARYCYSVFMRHLVRLNKATDFIVPNTVAELGPGDFLGLGLCALLSDEALSTTGDFVIIRKASTEHA